MPAARLDGRPVSNLLELGTFYRKHGIRPWDGVEPGGVIYRFVADAELADGPGGDYAVIRDPTTVSRWKTLLADAAERCEKYHEAGCACDRKRNAHAPDRTTLIVQPVV